MTGQFRASLIVIGLSFAISQGAHRAYAERRGYKEHQLLKVTIRNESQLRTLMALDAASRDFEIWSDGVGLGVIDVRVSPEQKHLLDAGGIRYEVFIEDLHRHIEEVFAGPEDEGFFDAYRTYDEHVAFMNQLVVDYPDLAEMVNLGLSVQGRPLWAIRITGPGKEKPGVMYHGGQHGNELTGVVVVAYMAQYLVTNYCSDPHVQSLVDNVEWFLLPIMNPDGYENGRRHNANGFDLNRNWDGPDPLHDPPFSQPETAALRDFFLAHPNVDAYIDFHTYGNMIMWPWAYTGELCEDHPTFQILGVEMRDRIFDMHGTWYGSVGPLYTTIYPVRGASIDYTYGNLGLWSFTLEVGCCGYFVPTTEILPTAEEIAPTMVLLAEWVSDCSGNSLAGADDFAVGNSDDYNGNYTPNECKVQPDFDTDGLIDVCDPDIDDDGIPNEKDVCDFTPRGTPIDAEGRPMGDTDGDCDVDLIDYWSFKDCLLQSGPGGPTPPEPCISAFDYDTDGNIDLADFGGFINAFTGIR